MTATGEVGDLELRGLDLTSFVAAARAARLLCGHDEGAGPVVLHDRAALVVRVGDVVLKVHPEGTDPSALRARMRVAGAAGVLLAPLLPEPVVLGGHLVSVWPYGIPVDQERPAEAPFLPAATLLARLHAGVQPVPGLPRHGAVRRVATTVSRARAVDAPRLAGAVRVLERAGAALPAWARDPAAVHQPGRPCRVAHGDWHFGQLVRPVAGASMRGPVNAGPSEAIGASSTSTISAWVTPPGIWRGRRPGSRWA